LDAKVLETMSKWRENPLTLRQYVVLNILYLPPLYQMTEHHVSLEHTLLLDFAVAAPMVESTLV